MHIHPTLYVSNDLICSSWHLPNSIQTNELFSGTKHNKTFFYAANLATIAKFSQVQKWNKKRCTWDASQFSCVLVISNSFPWHHHSYVISRRKAKRWYWNAVTRHILIVRVMSHIETMATGNKRLIFLNSFNCPITF